MAEKVVMFLDGGFVKKKLQEKPSTFPTVQDVVELCRLIMSKPRLNGMELFRVYYYDAPPLDGHAENPLDGTKVNFSATQTSSLNRALIDSLELQPDFAVRRGSLMQSGWKLGKYALRNGLELFGSVQNLFDRIAPLDPQTYGAIHYNTTYHLSGAIGRFFTVGLKYRWM